ncbi:MAG TPA: ABC transporter substrate-binding protein [Trebonia sp.]
MLWRTSGKPSLKGGRRFRVKTALTVAAVAGLAVVTACSSSGSSGGSNLSGVSGAGFYGSVPAASGTPHAGTLTVAQPSGIIPWILPIITSADNSIYTVYNFDYQLYRPLYWYQDGTKIEENKSESLANDPVYSNGDKTVSVTLKSNYKWSNGQPITSKDVEFWYDEMAAGVKESPANWATYVPGEGMPDEVSSVSTPSSSTIVFNLKKSVNPTWFTEDEIGVIQPMPSSEWAIDSTGGKTLDFTNPSNAKKIFDYLTAQSKSISTYASSPLWQTVDGPYKLSSFNTTSDDYDLAPNSSYGGPHASVVSPVDITSYTSDASEFNAIKSGAVDVGYVPTDDVTAAKSLSANYTEFGYPGYGWQGAFYNFKDKTGDFNNIISQLYVRQALQELVNQPGIIKAYLHGAGGSDYGSVGEYPSTQYTPSDDLTNLYPYSPTNAEKLLSSHGWKIVPNGTDTCQKAGTAADECGAGIPAGTKLAFPLTYASGIDLAQEVDTAFASTAKSAGINVTLSVQTFATLTSEYDDVANPSDDNKWAISDFGGFTDSTYPTTFGLFNSTGSSNFGGYSDPEADALINDSVNSTNASAVSAEMSYIAKDLPVMFQPNPDWAGEGGLIAINKKISGTPASFEEYAEYALNPEFWYFKS